ncbi:hypothetical protein [Aquimarina sp. LLG6339-5]|uniref:hypothetical protein n=1 Tax=Aquimarina sp. LLG6339-5 TaxID=3160830 RepID=UPI003869B4E7
MYWKTVLILITLTSNYSISQEDPFGIKNNYLSEFIEFEKQNEGFEIIDKSHENLSDIIDHISFIRSDNSVPNLDLVIRYVFTKKDSLVTEIRYEWDTANNQKGIAKKKGKKFKKNLYSFFLKLENRFLYDLGESEITGELTAQTEINYLDNYSKHHLWDFWKLQVSLGIEMSNGLVKNNFPEHSVQIIFRKKILGSLDQKTLIKRKINEIIKPDITKKNFKNRSMIPFVSQCRDNHTYSCLQNYVSDLILKKATEKKLVLKKDTLNIGITIKPNGEISEYRNKSSNLLFKKIAREVISQLKNIEPSYVTRDEEYIASTFTWYIIVENNKLSNRLKE